MKVVVGLGSCGIAAGANKVYQELKSEIEDKHLDIDLKITGCVGMCHLEPIVDFYDDDGHLERYVKVSQDKVLGLLDKALKKELDQAQELLDEGLITKEEYEAQRKKILSNYY